MTGAEFAQSFRADELDQQTVIIEGRIVPGPLPPAACSPFYGAPPCDLGVIDGIDPQLSVSALWSATPKGQSTATFDQPRIDWPYWWLPALPIDGPFLIWVQGGTAQYAGRVYPNPAGLTWSVSEAKAIDPASLSPDEVVLVDGWLTGIGGMLDCAPSPSSVIKGLPNRWCANSGFLFDSAAQSANATDVERQAGIEVQDRAYYKFAPGPEPEVVGAGEPQSRLATYALAPRLEGWCRDLNEPCWQWSLAKRVHADFSLVPSRVIACGHVSILMPSPTAATAPPGETVRDETGLVRDCIAGFAPPDAVGVVVENPLPNTLTLDVSWPGTACDTPAALTFRRAESGYELIGATESPPCADDRSTRHSLMIGLVQGLPADSVHVVINGQSGAAATAAPTPTAAVLPCTTGDHHAIVLDLTGWVDACQTVEGTTAVASIAVAEFSGDGKFGLRIFWSGSACDAAPIFRLSRPGMRVTLEGELYGEPCGPSDVDYEVRLLLNTDVPPSAVDASLRRLSEPAPTFESPAPAASADFDTAAGSFTISARAGKATYVTGEAIDITGEIVWNGAPGTSVEIVGDETDVTNALVHFGWEQLDDSLIVAPRFVKSCQSTTLQAGVPVTASFEKETGNFGDQLHDAFWKQYFASTTFTLPPGRYRLMARAEFSVGECSRDHVVLYVPIFIFVTE